MGTVEFKVNGVKISEIYFRNHKHISGDQYSYYYEYWQPEKVRFRGIVVHNRSMGIESLVKIIIETMQNREEYGHTT